MRLSVIIAMYNSCKNVVKTLRDLLSQEHKGEYEVIVINDGSEDDTSEVERICKESGFIYRSQANDGEASARNLGVELAKGDYFTFIDADDEIEPNYLTVILSEIEGDQYDFITHRWRFINGFFGDQHEPPLLNWNVWANVYRNYEPWRSVKFDRDIIFACDTDWLKRAHRPDMKDLYSDNYVNIYHIDNPNSLTKRYERGEIPIRRGENG